MARELYIYETDPANESTAEHNNDSLLDNSENSQLDRAEPLQKEICGIHKLDYETVDESNAVGTIPENWRLMKNDFLDIVKDLIIKGGKRGYENGSYAESVYRLMYLYFAMSDNSGFITDIDSQGR